MRASVSKLPWVLLLVGLVGGGGWITINTFSTPVNSVMDGKASRAVPVEVHPIERGEIELQRTFSGTIEAAAQFVVAPKVDGRIASLAVDLSDRVSRGQVVATLDDAEYVQAVSQAQADLAVAQANHSEAKSALEIVNRELSRVKTLLDRGVASEAQFDTARAEKLAKQAQLEVAEAQVLRAQASLETARIRLGYTRVAANWAEGDEQRVVAERFVDEGQTVSANTPLLAIVELDPVTGVIFVTEKDYTRLKAGQMVQLTTDAWPDTQFAGRISRISPIFKQATRQARVELVIENHDQRLKPGMFIRATVVLDRTRDAVILPENAITRRGDRTGVFVVSADGQKVAWREVRVGIRNSGRVQVEGKDLTGRVVTLGQQLLDDGSRITVPVEVSRPATASREAPAK